MFLVTSITMLRERTTGTLERLMTLPLAKLDLLLGYGIVRAGRRGPGDDRVRRRVRPARRRGGRVDIAVVLLAIANAVLGMALGLLASAFARTEFQAVQFMPAFILPQLLLCGLFVPRDQMAWPETISALADDLSAYDALERVATDGSSAGGVGRRRGHRMRDPTRSSSGVVTLRRRTP